MIIGLDDLQTVYNELKSRQQEYIHATASHPAHMLILLTPEVDSLCSARILIALLKCDNVTFVVKPVQYYQELIDTTKLYLKDENTVSIFMINCGGSASLAEELQLESRVTIYVLDSHRPYHHLNVHNEQIKILHDSLDPSIKYPQWIGDDEDENLDDDADLDVVGPGMLSDDDDDEEDDDDDDLASQGSESRRADGSEGLDHEGSPSAKRRKRNEKVTAKRERANLRRIQAQQLRNASRAERKRMADQYERDLASYYSGTSYGAATSILMYELSAQLNKATNDELWLCMIGVSDTLVHERVDPSRYGSIAAHLSGQIGNFNVPLEQQAEALRLKAQEAHSQATEALVTPVGHVIAIDEYRCALLRHWSLYASLKHAPYIAARLLTWSEQGKVKMRQLLTDIGVKTADAKQLFRVMKASDKGRVEELLEEKAADARYRIEDMRFKNFSRQLNPTLSVSACDMIHALTSLLELPHHDGKLRTADWRWEHGFWAAWKALQQGDSNEAYGLIQQGIAQAINLQQVLFRQATFLLTTNKSIHSAGTFRWVKLQEQADSMFLARPLTLAKLGFFLFECGAVQQELTKPLVLCSPIPTKGAYLVVAITGTMHTPGVSLRNNFGGRFREAAVPTLPEKEEEDEQLDETEEERRERLIESDPSFVTLRVKQEAFDQAVVEVQAEDLELFLERV